MSLAELGVFPTLYFHIELRYGHLIPTPAVFQTSISLKQCFGQS